MPEQTGTGQDTLSGLPFALLSDEANTNRNSVERNDKVRMVLVMMVKVSNSYAGPQAAAPLRIGGTSQKSLLEECSMAVQMEHVL